MNILIDDSPLHNGHSYRGIGAYTRNLYTTLQAHSGGDTIRLKSESKVARPDLIHYPYFDLFFHTLPRINTIPTVVTIHDVIPLLYPHAYPVGLRGRVNLLLQRLSLMSCTAIITDSQCSKRDIVDKLNIPEEKIFPVYLAPADSFHPSTTAEIEAILSTYGITKPYLLYVGDINYNKNIPALITAFSSHATTHNLVLVSKSLANTSQEALQIKHLITRQGLNKSVKIIDTLEPANSGAIRNLFSGADWYIQPSLYEGFGLPPLEAMKCGTPVISSTGGSLPEIVGQAAVLFDPEVSGDLIKALEFSLAMTQQEREQIIRKGFEHVAAFSWEHTAMETMNVYRKVTQ
jgi:glycosyltransferase involved in cell wall biosynthesis